MSEQPKLLCLFQATYFDNRIYRVVKIKDELKLEIKEQDYLNHDRWVPATHIPILDDKDGWLDTIGPDIPEQASGFVHTYSQSTTTDLHTYQQVYYRVEKRDSRNPQVFIEVLEEAEKQSKQWAAVMLASFVKRYPFVEGQDVI